jgi:hypothetical protein
MPSYGSNPAKGLVPRVCEVCGTSFQPYRDSQTTCGLPCYKRSAAVRKKHDAWNRRPEVRERKNAARRVSVNPARREMNLRGQVGRYGLTMEQYEQMVAAQDNRCAICGDRPDPNGVKASSRLHVDHNRKTGAVRKLLCGRCNPGIGYFLDDPERLLKAAAYLKEHT